MDSFIAILLCMHFQTAEEFKNLYDQRLESSNYNVENTAYHAYDGLWSLTFAINRYCICYNSYVHHPQGVC